MERWAVLSGDGREAACDIGVNALRGPDSRWPVDTGRSKRAWQRLGNQSTSRIHNPAFYASYAEQGIPSPRTRGAARRTLARAAPRMRRAAQRSGLVTVDRAGESRADIIAAGRRRQRAERDAQLFQEYWLNWLDRGGVPGPRIPAAVRMLDRALRQDTS